MSARPTYDALAARVAELEAQQWKFVSRRSASPASPDREGLVERLAMLIGETPMPGPGGLPLTVVHGEGLERLIAEYVAPRLSLFPPLSEGGCASRDHAPTAYAACVAEETTLVPGEWKLIDDEARSAIRILACSIHHDSIEVVRWRDGVADDGDLGLVAGWVDTGPHADRFYANPRFFTHYRPLNPLVPGEVKP